jgi:hypothetical protein
MVTCVSGTRSAESGLARKIDAAGWGLVFVWIGVALLAHVGWGAGLVGVGVITLAVQAWRRHAAVKVERFSIVLGAVLVMSGLWNVLGLRVDVVPVLFIVAGLALLATAWRRPPEERGDLQGHAQSRP